MKTVYINSKGLQYELLIDKNISLPATPYLTNGYAFMKVYNDKGKRITLSVHRYIMGLGRGQQGTGKFVDHINGNKLDNRLENLRIASNKENQANKVSKGYSWNKDRQKFQSRIRIDGMLIALGYFTDEEEAQKAYRKAHVEAFGEFSPWKGDVEK